MVNLQERDCRLRDSLKNEWQEPKPTAQAQLDPEQRAAHRSGLGLGVGLELARDADSDLESV